MLCWISCGAATLRCGFERAKGLLYKGIKRGQDRRIDVPTIGVETIKRAAKAGLGGVVIESNASYIVDYRGTLACADKLGLFFMGA